jgi:hypothetical protein
VVGSKILGAFLHGGNMFVRNVGNTDYTNVGNDLQYYISTSESYFPTGGVIHGSPAVFIKCGTVCQSSSIKGGEFLD